MKDLVSLDDGVAELTLSAAWYERPALEAAAEVLAGRARCAIVFGRGGHRVTLTPVGRASPRTLAGDFLDEALNAQLRAEVVSEARPFTGPVLAVVFTEGFTAVPKDPLGEMDPAVAQLREDETAALMARAG